jgi:uncharacterized membrane protein YfcA
MIYTIVAIAIYAIRGHVLWLPGLCLAMGNASGAWIGTHFTIKKGEGFIRIMFNLAVIILALKLLLMNNQ